MTVFRSTNNLVRRDSTGTAFTSGGMGRDTAGLAGLSGANPENGSLRDMDSRLVIQAVGLRTKFGGALVGGMGVGGRHRVPLTRRAHAGLDVSGAE